MLHAAAGLREEFTGGSVYCPALGHAPGGPILTRFFSQRRRVDVVSVPGRNIKWMSGHVLSDRDPFSNSERRNSQPASEVVKPLGLCHRRRLPRSQFPEPRHSSANPRQNFDLHLKIRRGNADAKPVETTASGSQWRRTDLRHLLWRVAPGEGNYAVC